VPRFPLVGGAESIGAGLAKKKATANVVGGAAAMSAGRTSSSSSVVSFAYELVETGTLPSPHKNAFVKYAVLDSRNGKPVTVRAWARQIAADGSEEEGRRETDHNIEQLTDLLSRQVPYGAIFFETPPVNSATSQRQPMEFVVVDAPELRHFVDAKGADHRAFAEHFAKCPKDESACAFPSLGRDALLVAPRPPLGGGGGGGDDDDDGGGQLAPYSDLANFVRRADVRQVMETWRLAVRHYLDRLEDPRGASAKKAGEPAPRDGVDDAPVWLSTSGMGIAWLHLRLDSRPKYYTYRPYRVWPFEASPSVLRLAAPSNKEGISAAAGSREVASNGNGQPRSSGGGGSSSAGGTHADGNSPTTKDEISATRATS